MSNTYRIWRRMQMPDFARVYRYQSLPEQGPKVLFFSGGSALNKISRVLKQYTHHSLHLVTPFDSGGSSASLRAEFDMPAVGDLRSRLMALADETVMGQPDVYALFTYRFDKHATLVSLHDELDQLVAGTHELIESIPNPMRALIQTQLGVTQNKISDGFDLRGASIGNLIISGGYLNNQQQLDPIVFLFSRIVKTLGEVKTILDAPYHLAVELDNGEKILGQHRITGKEHAALESPIKHMWLNKGLKKSAPINSMIADDRRDMIESTDLICYPPGSFYSSLLANLIPQGVGRTICQNPNPKVYIPNLGIDPEQFGLSLMTRIERLVSTILADAQSLDEIAYGGLDYLLLDDQYDYGAIDESRLSALGVDVIRTPLISHKADKYDEQMVVKALLSMV